MLPWTMRWEFLQEDVTIHQRFSEPTGLTLLQSPAYLFKNQTSVGVQTLVPCTALHKKKRHQPTPLTSTWTTQVSMVLCWR
jgi:hypothetical protein